MNIIIMDYRNMVVQIQATTAIDALELMDCTSTHTEYCTDWQGLIDDMFDYIEEACPKRIESYFPNGVKTSVYKTTLKGVESIEDFKEAARSQFMNYEEFYKSQSNVMKQITFTFSSMGYYVDDEDEVRTHLLNEIVKYFDNHNFSFDVIYDKRNNKLLK